MSKGLPVQGFPWVIFFGSHHPFKYKVEENCEGNKSVQCPVQERHGGSRINDGAQKDEVLSRSTKNPFPTFHEAENT